MPIAVRCPNCGSRLKVPEESAGTTVPCPKCAEELVVPAAVPTLVARPVARPVAAPAPEEDEKEPMRIDVQLALNNRVWFQGRGLDTRLDGNLHVTGELGTPLRAQGTIRTAGGTYRGYGQELTIERGVLTFAGPLENPRLNILALRKGLPVEAGVEVLGSTSHPRVRLVSTPDVPEAWHRDALHRHAVELSPQHYHEIRLHKGSIPGRLLDGGALSIERTKYFDFAAEQPWYGLRQF